MLLALTRDVPDSINECELTHLQRQPIDVALARRQHRQYEEVLESLGCRVMRLPTEHTLPDSVFVEDTAVVLDEIAVITWPGAQSRRREIPSAAVALSKHRPLARIAPPGTLDGGDVLQVGRKLYVGRSTRTNDEGIHQLHSAVARYGYQVMAVDFSGVLHLKSAATLLDDDLLLLDPRRVDPQVFAPAQTIAVDPAEEDAANVLTINGIVLISSSWPRTRERLLAHRLDARTVDASELEKAEAGLTCCSLIFEDNAEAVSPLHGR
jgi:dimethylargininase